MNPKTTNKRFYLWLLLAIAVIAIDIISKQLVVNNLQFADPLYLLPFLNFTLAYNRGAAFSFLSAQSGWQVTALALVAIVVAVGIVLWLRRIASKYTLQSCGLALVLGGAVGNLIDRIHYGYVIDFIDFHINHWHFAFFNVADSAITIGVILMIIDFLFSKDKKGQAHEKNSARKS